MGTYDGSVLGVQGDNLNNDARLKHNHAGRGNSWRSDRQNKGYCIQPWLEKLFSLAFTAFLFLIVYNNHKLNEFVQQQTVLAKEMYQDLDRSIQSVADDVRSIKSRLGTFNGGAKNKQPRFLLGEEINDDDLEAHKEQKQQKFFFFLAFVIVSIIVFSVFDIYYSVLAICVALVIYPVVFKVRRSEKIAIVILLIVFLFLNVCNRKEGTIIVDGRMYNEAFDNSDVRYNAAFLGQKTDPNRQHSLQLNQEVAEEAQAIVDDAVMADNSIPLNQKNTFGSNLCLAESQRLGEDCVQNAKSAMSSFNDLKNDAEILRRSGAMSGDGGVGRDGVFQGSVGAVGNGNGLFNLISNKENFGESDQVKRLEYLEKLKKKKPELFKSLLQDQIAFAYVLFREINLDNYYETMSIIKNILDQKIKLEEIEKLNDIRPLITAINTNDPYVMTRDTNNLQQQQYFKYSHDQLRQMLFEGDNIDYFRKRMQEKFVQLFFDDGDTVVDYIVKNIELQDELNQVLRNYSKTLNKIRKDLSLIAANNKKFKGREGFAQGVKKEEPKMVMSSSGFMVPSQAQQPQSQQQPQRVIDNYYTDLSRNSQYQPYYANNRDQYTPLNQSATMPLHNTVPPIAPQTREGTYIFNTPAYPQGGVLNQVALERSGIQQQIGNQLQNKIDRDRGTNYIYNKTNHQYLHGGSNPNYTSGNNGIYHPNGEYDDAHISPQLRKQFDQNVLQGAQQRNQLQFQQALQGGMFRINDITGVGIDGFDDAGYNGPLGEADNLGGTFAGVLQRHDGSPGYQGDGTTYLKDDAIFNLNKQMIDYDYALDQELTKPRDYHDIANRSLRMRVMGNYEGIQTPGDPGAHSKIQQLKQNGNTMIDPKMQMYADVNSLPV